MTADERVPQVFIGSSGEGRDVASRLAMHLESDGSIEATVWNQSVFQPGNHVLDDLIHQASAMDFAVLVLGPDDSVDSRDTKWQAPRDNVVFELGLFIGALGKNRTYMVQPDAIPLKLPTDLSGITQARYPANRADLSSALNGAGVQLRDRINDLGTRKPNRIPDQSSSSSSAPPQGIEDDLRILESNLVAQGWTVRRNPVGTTWRVVSPRGIRRHLKMGPASEMQQSFDHLVRELRGLGVRVDNTLRRSKVG